MTSRYHIGQCPLCRQGNLHLFRALPSGDVYGHCEECEHGYRSPDELTAEGGGFLTLLCDEEAAPATMEEIARSVWANHTVKAVEG